MVTLLRPKMASLLGETLFEISGQGPPPAKDYFQLIITKNEQASFQAFFQAFFPLPGAPCKVKWRSWIISLRVGFRGAAPKELKESHYDFLHDKSLQQEVGIIFGQNILHYTKALCQGEFDYLERLPDDILLRIVSYLPLKDVTRFAQTTRKFRKEFWEQTVRSRCAEFTPDMETLANAMGWRKVFFLFFNASGPKEKKASS